MKKSTILIAIAATIIISWLCIVPNPRAEEKPPGKAWEYQVIQSKEEKLGNQLDLREFLEKHSKDDWEYCDSVRVFSDNLFVFKRLKK